MGPRFQGEASAKQIGKIFASTVQNVYEIISL